MAPPSSISPDYLESTQKYSNGGKEHGGSTLAILGCGAMGTAILLGILSAQANRSEKGAVSLLPSRFMACVRRAETGDSIRSKLASQTLDSAVTVYTNKNVAAVREADMVLLACQPHVYRPLLEEPGMSAALVGKPIMSVLAGVTSEEIEHHLEIIAARNNGRSDNGDSSGAFLVMRVMPNVASAVQASSTVLEVRPPQHPRPLPKHLEATAHAIFSCVGTVFATRPDTFAICTTLNGSTPAFFAMVMDGLVDGAVALGLSHTEAIKMAAATMRGTADLVLSGKSTQDLRYEVACPGGATMQGLRVLEESRTRAVWMDATRAATCEQSVLGSGLKVQRD
ncbi:hypothetical protein CDD81_2035 [Ophiocordyceps australis]|uniref:Pyrroline-5-carboxylate reductase n=1 Tax=Ophiocordyceps australis TaxID=1399860 RepID=A0A2C5YDP3_9HYPO|nr:hypothetical protein CDD81_2035 [Ophiocordyceps australis]